MLNSGNIAWVNSTNLKVDGAAITKGECKSAEGKEFDFTEPLMNKILSHFNEAVPLKIGHGDTPEVGRAYKLGFDSDSQNLPFEGHVYGDDKRKLIESYGYNKISPEIDFQFDAAGNPIDGVITALAFVRVPAMDGTEVNCQKMTFSSPSENKGSEDMKQDGVMVFYPKGTTITIPGEEIGSDHLTTPTGTSTGAPEINMSPSPANFEADVEKYKKMSASFEAEVVTLKETTAALETNVTDLNAQLNDYKTKATSLEAEINTFIQEKTDAVVAELKTMGFKSPETIAAELPAKQRIEVLKQMKNNFVITAPSDSPVTPVEVPKGEMTVREKAIAGIPAELHKYINSGV